MGGYSLRRNWRGSVLGAVVGVAMAVHNPKLFHGHLTSPATVTGLLVSLAISVSVGAFIESRIYRSDRPPIPATVFGTAVYVFCCAACVAAAVLTIYVKYPGGEGLLKATHRDNVEELVKGCMKARETGFGDSLKVTRFFCSCVAEFIATKIDAGETKERLGEQVVGEARTACRKG